MSLEQDIRAEIENIKKLKLAVGEINNHLSALEQLGKDSKENVYQKGCEEGYANGYKKGIEDGKACDENGCKGCKWESQKGYDEPCKHCCNAYLNQYAPMPKDDSIKVGDEVIWTTNDVTLIVTSVYESGVFHWCDGVAQDGKVYHTLAENNQKTGKHYDIQSILEAMRT